MKQSLSLLCAFFLLLGACSTHKNTPAFSASDISRQSPQMAQLAIYYPPSFFWSDKSANVSAVTKSDECALKAGTFFIRDITPAAKTRIAASPCGMPGVVSELSIKTAAGMTYYIRISPNDETLTGRLGTAGLAKPKEKLNYSGPFRIDIMGEASALKEMKHLHRCEACMMQDTTP